MTKADWKKRYEQVWREVLAQPVKLFSPVQSDADYIPFCDKIGCIPLKEEGDPFCGIWPTPRGGELWLHVSLKDTGQVQVYDGRRVPSGKPRILSYFPIGNAYTVRWLLDRETDQFHFNLPADREALPFIRWWRHMTPEEWMAAYPQYEYERLSSRVTETELNKWRADGWEVVCWPVSGPMLIFARRGQR